MTQQKLFVSAPAAPAQRQKRPSTAICKRPTCGHSKADHVTIGEPVWRFEGLEIYEKDGILRIDVENMRMPNRERYARSTWCALCLTHPVAGCPSFLARESPMCRCGHAKFDHGYPSESDWGEGEIVLRQRRNGARVWIWQVNNPMYWFRLRCFRCQCRQFHTGEFRNPFLPGNAEIRKPVSMTMCANADCRHAKRDHHRGGCSGKSPQTGQTAACSCTRFVNPFAKSQETQPELFPPATAEEVKP